MDEIILDTGVPLMVDPAGVTSTLYNHMGADDPLFVSTHGDVNKKWLKVEGGDYVKFANITWLLQNTSGQRIFPIYETV